MIPHKETIEFLASRLSEKLAGGEAFAFRIATTRQSVFVRWKIGPRPNLGIGIPQGVGSMMSYEHARRLAVLLLGKIQRERERK